MRTQIISATALLLSAFLQSVQAELPPEASAVLADRDSRRARGLLQLNNELLPKLETLRALHLRQGDLNGANAIGEQIEKLNAENLELSAVTSGKSDGRAVFSKTVKGQFYVSVDDAATIYVNGNAVHRASVGETTSIEFELKVGDRVTMKLRDDGGERQFMVAFVSLDRQTVVSFDSKSVKIAPDANITDFTVNDFQNWPKRAINERKKTKFPVKSYSDWLWGDLSKCALVSIVELDMFRQMPK